MQAPYQMDSSQGPFPWWASLQKLSSTDSMLDFMTFQTQNWHCWHLSRSPFCSESANPFLVEKVAKNERKGGQMLFSCPSALQICFFSTESTQYSVVSIICLFPHAKCVYPNTQTLCESFTWKFLTCMQMSKLFTDSWALWESLTQKSQVCVKVLKIYTAFIQVLRYLYINDCPVIWCTRKSVQNVDGMYTCSSHGNINLSCTMPAQNAEMLKYMDYRQLKMLKPGKQAPKAGGCAS